MIRSSLHEFLIKMGEKPTGNKKQDMKLAQKHFVKYKDKK
tara:strand:+ start:4312 stop:4431 length:120 start_codon:yes stop_codon:yes gene_type:complete